MKYDNRVIRKVHSAKDNFRNKRRHNLFIFLVFYITIELYIYIYRLYNAIKIFNVTGIVIRVYCSYD